MKIRQVFNNNVVMADDPERGSVIAVGTGIGYRRKKGDLIDASSIQQIYLATDKKILDVVNQISPEAIEVTETIREYAKEECSIEMNDEVFLLLADHISFAVKRLSEGMELDNPFLPEIHQYFQNEYKVGLFARKCIEGKFGITIPDEEIGYICMHIIASEYHQDKRFVPKVFQVMNVCIDYIMENYLHGVSSDSIAYNRLVTHIKFFAQRYVENKESNKKDELLNSTIVNAFQEESSCINGLSKVLKDRFGREMTQSEKNYIILHLRNCKLS